jgi:two-component system response regulator HupR/HoxA
MHERPNVLVVDGEDAARASTAALLAEDFDVKDAAGDAEALALLEAQPFDVLCADFHVSGRGGLELLRTATSARPYLSGVLVTGYREYLDRRERHEVQGLFYLVLKPYQPRELIAMVRRAAESSRLKRTMTSLSSELTLRRWES